MDTGRSPRTSIGKSTHLAANMLLPPQDANNGSLSPTSPVMNHRHLDVRCSLFELGSDAERLIDEPHLLDNMAFCQPRDLPYYSLIKQRARTGSLLHQKAHRGPVWDFAA
jgi:hypothetical protein